MRRGRASALAAMDEGLRALRAELVEARRALAAAEDGRVEALRKSDDADRAQEQLQERHEALQARKAACEAELRRHEQAAAATERAERQATREGAWAREGPETEALKEAKMSLAEILSITDEAQLRARRQKAELQHEIDEAKEENERLRSRPEPAGAPPGGLRASISRLFGGRGRADSTGADDCGGRGG
eukprot:CAMPEP_0177468148 /NCGR_PEP_ID=MMETSP0369-20130122/18910_1 /TAXON_ID=447022 ORGANISM="Scrippsiella hangoei-like, Strain SHHI-4" /NCGR_SAMPLE_ID=MMETSP0369 /ASSEMBLY_ACC=CAM_ASM_000364 /LENGTH=188 /DNA_ID=CAMNT_0018942315 /DNA_START=12 /DNA_END=574 /DNA_ORIENTATION=-